MSIAWTKRDSRSLKFPIDSDILEPECIRKLVTMRFLQQARAGIKTDDAVSCFLDESKGKPRFLQPTLLYSTAGGISGGKMRSEAKRTNNANPHNKVISGLSGPPSAQGAGVGARTRDIKIPADIRADSLATVPPTPPCPCEKDRQKLISNTVC
ncbi:hypothetical protein PoB_007411400 [Plakobranchus ocellatus]|uniref:Uncharacterized protein n=1 Tax=Plakobranchus ocellatus TaxID=259542 RepID=A0AAV4DUA9_9GAST|nr:hypothetical protein PoB_007411400 [Plakobranchus ocellatus]